MFYSVLLLCVIDSHYLCVLYMMLEWTDITTHLGALVVFCMTFLVVRWHLSHHKYPPGPPALPVIGSLPWLMGDLRGRYPPGPPALPVIGSLVWLRGDFRVKVCQMKPWQAQVARISWSQNQSQSWASCYVQGFLELLMLFFNENMKHFKGNSHWLPRCCLCVTRKY